LGGHFALLSILSNITAGIILYINYPVKIANNITILKEDEHIICEIRDIGTFFITLRTPEKELIIEPNSKFCKKNIRYNHE
tara:strand:+ start:1629 stop:1871 length:243 start_codon:yes stop_codon:yes gene_type:complete